MVSNDSDHRFSFYSFCSLHEITQCRLHLVKSYKYDQKAVRLRLRCSQSPLDQGAIISVDRVRARVHPSILLDLARALSGRSCDCMSRKDADWLSYFSSSPPTSTTFTDTNCFAITLPVFFGGSTNSSRCTRCSR